MKRLIKFSGILSGDCECFCWEVDRQTYIRITGHKPTCYDKGQKRGAYRLYPNDLWGDCFMRGAMLTFKVSVEGPSAEGDGKGE